MLGYVWMYVTILEPDTQCLIEEKEPESSCFQAWLTVQNIVRVKSFLLMFDGRNQDVRWLSGIREPSLEPSGICGAWDEVCLGGMDEDEVDDWSFDRKAEELTLLGDIFLG